MGTQRLFEIVGFFVNAQCHRRFQHSVICLNLHDDFSMGTIQSHPNGGRTKVTFACECPLLPRLFVPASALVLLGQLSEKKTASRPLSFDHPVPVQGSHSFPSTEKLASHRTILPCRRKKCSSLEVVVLWSATIIENQDISRYIKIIKMFEESRSSLSRDSLSSTHPEASAGSVEIPITAGSIETSAASVRVHWVFFFRNRDLNVPMFQSQKPQVHV